MKLLLVEDEVQLSEALTQILMKNKYSVDAVHDGDDGLNYGLTGLYDIKKKRYLYSNYIINS